MNGHLYVVVCCPGCLNFSGIPPLVAVVRCQHRSATHRGKKCNKALKRAELIAQGSAGSPKDLRIIIQRLKALKALGSSRYQEAISNGDQLSAE